MSLNEKLPADASSTLASLNELLRETRAAVNASISAISALGGVITSDTDLDIPTGTTYIIVGEDISDQAVEVINLTAEGACSLAEIRSGRAGQVKIIKFGDSNVTIVNSLSNIVLNRTGNLSSTSGVILALFNVGGDVDSNIDGVWYELGCSKVLVDDGTMVTAFAKTLLDDANALAVLTTLGIQSINGITATAANINEQISALVASLVSQADLTKLHAITSTAASIDSATTDVSEATSTPTANKLVKYSSNGIVKGAELNITGMISAVGAVNGGDGLATLDFGNVSIGDVLHIECSGYMTFSEDPSYVWVNIHPGSTSTAIIQFLTGEGPFSYNPINCMGKVDAIHYRGHISTTIIVVKAGSLKVICSTQSIGGTCSYGASYGGGFFLKKA